MTNREKYLMALKIAKEEQILISNGIRFYPVIENALDFAIADIQKQEERSKGCDYCSYKCFLQDSEDMEISLYNHTDSEVYDVYPNFCPMCGRPLKGEE